jgi:hypothetical protein
MDFTKYYYESDVSLKIPVTYVLEFGLNRVSFIIEFIQKNKPDILNDYIKTLNNQFSKLKQYDIQVSHNTDILKNYPEIHRGCINKILNLLNYEKYDDYMIEEIVEIKVDDMIRSMYVMGYYLTYPLVEILPYSDAIELNKQITNYIIQTDPVYASEYNTIDDYLNDSWIKFFDQWKAHDAIIGKSNENTIIAKITKCRWYELMKEMNLDPSFFYSIVCYSDYEMRKKSNPYFELTRTKTLVEGEDYCDFCDRDTRYAKNYSHPPEEFWEQLK